jgi:uncharacterized protein
MTQQLETVIRLQRAVDDLRQAEELLEGVPAWMRELHQEHASRRAEIEAVEAAAEEASRLRRKAESASADAETRLKHFQQQISLVRTQREYSALLHEIDAVKAQIKGLEDQALSGLEEYDRAQQELEQQRDAFRDLDERYRQALARWEQEKPAVAQQAETLRAEVHQLRGELPRGVVALFDRLLGRRPGGAVSALRRTSGAMWACSSCNYRIRLQVVTDIRHGALVQCEGCKRILFVEENGA